MMGFQRLVKHSCEEGSVSKVLVVQPRGPEFSIQHLHKKKANKIATWQMQGDSGAY